MENEHAAVANLHVAAVTTEDSITMLYEVQPGPSDRSYGIHVAEVVGFPKSVLENAKRKVLEFESASYQATATADASVGGSTSKAAASPLASLLSNLTEADRAKVSAFVASFRSLSKEDVAADGTGKGKALIEKFRQECAACSSGGALRELLKPLENKM